MYRMTRRLSPTEVEFSFTTTTGNYDGLLEIGYDENYYYLPTYFKPGSTKRLAPSEIPVETQVQLARLAENAFQTYMDNHLHEVAFILQVS